MAVRDIQPRKPASSDGSAVRIVQIIVWPMVALILGLIALLYYHNKVVPTQISVAKVMTIQFNLLAAEHDRANFGAADADRTAAASGASATETPPVSVKTVTEVANSVAKVELKGSRVLWVDDNPQNNTYEQNALSALGIRFDTALSTDEALSMLDKTHYDLVISDFKRRDDPQAGLTLTDDLHKMSDAPPIIIYSASATPERESQMKERGAFGETSQALTLFQMVIDAVQRKKT